MTHSAFLRVKKLKGTNIIQVAAAHNLRTAQREHGARLHIAPGRTHLNESLMTHRDYVACPQAVAQRARALMQAAGITKLRKDAVLGLEWLFSLPPEHRLNERTYFADSTAWVAEHFGGVNNLLCADIHRDESAPHCHVIVIPLIGGKMQGSDAVGSPGKLRALNKHFFDHVATRYGLRTPEPMRGVQKAQAARSVIECMNARQDPALKSPIWQALRDGIERNPGPFMGALGLELTRSKPLRSMAQIFTSKGKGANVASPSNPIGFD